MFRRFPKFVQAHNRFGLDEKFPAVKSAGLTPVLYQMLKSLPFGQNELKLPTHPKISQPEVDLEELVWPNSQIGAQRTWN
ncbi:MAG: hypothetical protein CL917_01925 [Deltaproteobacteria bacterium]|nr:hypothetical protein [Deltaproteobacteria bacterium]